MTTDLHDRDVADALVDRPSLPDDLRRRLVLGVVTGCVTVGPDRDGRPPLARDRLLRLLDHQGLTTEDLTLLMGAIAPYAYDVYAKALAHPAADDIVRTYAQRLRTAGSGQSWTRQLSDAVAATGTTGRAIEVLRPAAGRLDHDRLLVAARALAEAGPAAIGTAAALITDGWDGSLDDLVAAAVRLVDQP